MAISHISLLLLFTTQEQSLHQRSLLASLSLSSSVRMSPTRTGPLTFLVIWRFVSSINWTLTWVTCPLDPVLPITFITVAFFGPPVSISQTWSNGKRLYKQLVDLYPKSKCIITAAHHITNWWLFVTYTLYIY